MAIHKIEYRFTMLIDSEADVGPVDLATLSELTDLGEGLGMLRVLSDTVITDHKQIVAEQRKLGNDGSFFPLAA